jgi:uncharacterized protein (DUF2267 family)
MTTGMGALDTSIQKVHVWLKEIMAEMGWDNRERAYSGLRAVLQALRDRLTLDEAFDLAAELPLALRGMYFEGWDRANNPTRERTRDAFLARVVERLLQIPDVDPERLTRTVFGVLGRHVSAGETSHVAAMLPRELRGLWGAAPTSEAPSAKRVGGRASGDEGRTTVRRAVKRIRQVLAEARVEGANPRDLPRVVSPRARRARSE